MAKVNELTKHELPAKLLEYKAKVENLQAMLMQREQERDLYLAAPSGKDGYQKQWLEKQSANNVKLQQ
jgi:hypothetical protein